jgi:flagellar basal body-associated protein FliL
MPPEQLRTSRPSASPRTRGKKNAWLGLALAVGLAAAGAFVVWGWPHSTSAAENSAEATLTLETFVVNLNESGQRAFLRVGITLGLAHPLSSGKAGAAPTALVRDTILSVLATAQADELLKIEGKRQLKDELLKALQERVPEMAVEHVYFTEFLVQM